MSKKKLTAFDGIQLVGIHKEPTFGPEGLAVDLRLPAASKCIEEQRKIIKQLQAELATAKAENEDLCDNVDAVRQERSDYLDGTLEGKLRAQLDKAINALHNLYDEQNGPPLLRREKQWQEAYDEAGDILKESGHEED